MRSSLRGKVALVVTLAAAAVGLHAAEAPAGAEFEGVWLGHITAPNATAEFGLAFTTTEKGQLVSVYFPDMFLYSVNFGPAEIAGHRCTLGGLGVTVAREGDELRGTFGSAAFPIVLQHRTGSFSAEPAVAEYPAAPKPAWTRPLHAPAWASPVVEGDMLCVATTDGAMHAFALDGTERWTWKGPHPLYGAAAATADAVFVRDEADDLVCLDRVDGRLRWRLALYDEKRAGGPLKPDDPTFNHRAASPVIDAKGVLYVGSAGGDLCAVRAKTGKLLWRYRLGAPVHAAPLLVGDDLVAGAFDGTVARINRRTQHELFRVRLPGPVVSTPALAADRLIVGSRDTLLYGLEAASGKIAWRSTYWFSWVESPARVVDGVAYIGGSDFRRVSAIDSASGRTLWATDVQGLSWGSPVVVTDTVYAGTAGQNLAGTVIAHRGGIVALDRKTGGVKWRYESAAPAGVDFTGFAGSLAATNDFLIGASVTGELVAFPLR